MEAKLSRLQWVEAALRDQVPEGGLWETDDPEVKRLLAEAFMRGWKAKLQLIALSGGALTPLELGLYLKAEPHRIAQWIKDGDVLALPVPGEEVLIPLVQFPEHMPRAPHPGMKEALAACDTDSEWGKLSYLLTPDPLLGGRMPIEAIERGDVEDAVHALARYGEHGAW